MNYYHYKICFTNFCSEIIDFYVETLYNLKKLGSDKIYGYK